MQEMCTTGWLSIPLVLWSCMIPYRRSSRVSGSDSVVFGLAALYCPCWLAKWSRFALLARMLRRQNWSIVTGPCQQPRHSSCEFWLRTMDEPTLSPYSQIFLPLFHLYPIHDVPMCVVFFTIGVENTHRHTDGLKGWAKITWKDGWKCRSILKSFAIDGQSLWP